MAHVVLTDSNTKDACMLGKFKRLFFIAFITVLGVVPYVFSAEPQDPLLEEFNQVTDWQQKQVIADQLLLTKQLTSQQRLAIYSTMAERAFTENDYSLALDFYQSQEKNSNINLGAGLRLSPFYFKAIKSFFFENSFVS